MKKKNFSVQKGPQKSKFSKKFYNIDIFLVLKH